MGVIFRDTLRALVRTRALYIWSLIFPIVLSTMFLKQHSVVDVMAACVEGKHLGQSRISLNSS